MCGVSSLGLDHTSLLGDTIDKIAWHKAGIFKVGIIYHIMVNNIFKVAITAYVN